MTAPAYLPRVADHLLRGQLEAMGAVLIEGAKSCGKTATARQCAASEVLLDSDPHAERWAELDPNLILDGATPRLIDEWQRAPRIWDAVRRAVHDRATKAQFILTGSATPDDRIQRHTGAGRFGVVRMRTMTLIEKQASEPSVALAQLWQGLPVSPSRAELGLRDYLHHIAVGGWPLLVGSSEDDARTYLDGYLDTIVERDLPEASGAPRSPQRALRLLYAYAQLLSQPATWQTILRRADPAEGADPGSQSPHRHTAATYAEALQRMMIIDEIPAWGPSVRSSKRLIRTPKRHLADPSLAAALMQMSTERMRRDLETTGFLFESLAAHDLRVYAEASGARCYHYREADGRLEVDYVLEARDGNWIGVEVKLGESEVDKAAQNLLRLADRVAHPPKALLVVTATATAYTREDGVHVVPLGLIGP